MTDFATNPATTVAPSGGNYLGVAVINSFNLQSGMDFSQGHAATAIPGAPPRPQLGLVFPRGRG